VRTEIEPEPLREASAGPARPAPRPGFRYKSLLWNLGFSIFGYTLSWSWPDLVGSTRVIGTVVVAGTSLVWFLIWLLFGSGLPRRVRWIGFALVVAGLALVPALVRVTAYTGDFVPVLSWRWTREKPPEPTPIVVAPKDDGAVHGQPTPYDYPGFMGAARDGVVRNVRLSRDWKAQPPKLLWRKSLGENAGFSSFAVVGDLAVTQQQLGDQELVVCYVVPTGSVLWTHANPARFEATIPIGGIGPRATPTIDNGRVYAIGATGILNCLDLRTGKPVWSVNVLTTNDAIEPRYGVASSPLVIGEKVIVCTGRSQGPAFKTLVAYDKNSGKLVWSAGEDTAGYGSPMLVKLDGQPQIVVVNDATVTGHDPDTGQELWQQPWPGETSNVAQPVAVAPDKILLTKGYGNGASLWQVRRNEQKVGTETDQPAKRQSLKEWLDDQKAWTVTEVWHDQRLLRTKLTSAVARDGYAYGLSDGILECVDTAKGSRKWKARGDYGHGQVILVDDLLLVQAESGDVALVEAVPKKYREVARFSPLSSRTWNYPVVSGPYLLVRNDREIACYEVPLEVAEFGTPHGN